MNETESVKPAGAHPWEAAESSDPAASPHFTIRNARNWEAIPGTRTGLNHFRHDIRHGGGVEGLFV